MNRYIVTLMMVVLTGSLYSQFVNTTIEAQLTQSHHSTNTLGGGVLFFDANNDGWEDIVMTGGDVDDALYINNGDGTFSDLSNNMAHNRAKSVQTSSCAAADFNRDGLTDLFFGTLNADEPNILLINIGENTFLNASSSAGITHAAQTMGATFLDYNHDGFLDIYVINYVQEDLYNRNEDNEIIGYEHICFPNFLYRNNGDMTFTEVSSELGLDGAGCSLAATTIPVNDNPFGLYVVHDFGEWVEPNELLVYDSLQSKFLDMAPDLGLDIGLYGMGVGVGDYDNDFDLDLYVSNIGHNYLMQKNILGKYEDVANEVGVDNTYDLDNGLFATSWANFFWDFNNDALLDLYVVNGHIPVADFLENSRRDNNKMYQNIGSEYIDISESSGLDYDHVNRGASLGDYNNDGIQDVIIATTRPGGSNVLPELDFQLFKNSSPQRQYIDIELQGQQSNLEGYGALIYLYAGTSRQMRYQYAGGVHCSQNSTTIHFGLANRTVIDSIVVEWPSGITDRVINPPVNEKIQIIESSNSFGIVGCMDSTNDFYNPNATINGGCAPLSTSTNSIQPDIDIVIGPNPASDILTFQVINRPFDRGNIELISSDGIILSSQSFRGDMTQLHIDQYPDGSYYLRLTTEENHTYLRSFVKISAR